MLVDTVVLAQMELWNKTMKDVPKLVAAFYYDKGIYYPPARTGNALFSSFQKGYINEVPKDGVEIGNEFLEQIKAERAIRDARDKETKDDK